MGTVGKAPHNRITAYIVQKILQRRRDDGRTYGGDA